MTPTTIIGMDLSGPTNTTDTAVVVFHQANSRIEFVAQVEGTDAAIRSAVLEAALSGPVVVGIDAPLSYEPGGGDRKRDRALRARAVEAGLRSGSVMPPTMTRMAYLSLRGLALTRLLDAPQIEIVEVHPGAAMALGGAPIDDVRAFASTPQARPRLLEWLESCGVSGLPADGGASSHFVAACSAAWAAHRWQRGESAWLAPAEMPFHPFDFAC